ncbi:MAG: hypothetical protein U0996_25000 [Planctomycetaceae bacterium]
MAVELSNDDWTVSTTVANGETWSGGDMRLAPDGRVGIVRGGPDLSAGAPVALKMNGYCRATSPVAFAAGATVAVVVATQTICATGTASSVNMGKALKACSAGKELLWDLNG